MEKLKTKIKDKSLCYWETIKPWRFLWWSGINKDCGYNHDWGYIDINNRECRRCGTKEFLYDVYIVSDDIGGRHRVEDWRERYK